MANATTDARFMALALGLARRGLGRVWPNPAVGCVIVKEGRVLGRGWTQPSGRPHAETEALGQAGAQARGSDLYVSLEPCAHHGETGPCAEAIVAAGPARVVVATLDPDPRVAGKGIERIEKAGIAVCLGVLEAAARELNAGFFSRLEKGRPLVTLKIASSLDGRIATHAGESQWITGETARAHGHLLRAQNDAIMVGIGTAMSDDPLLTCRLPGLEERSPVRIVVDSRLRLPLTSRLVASARTRPFWIVTLDPPPSERARAYEGAGVELIAVAPEASGAPDMAAALEHLGRKGLTRILVEGGSMLAATLVRARLVDRLVWFHAPSLIGGDGIPAAAAFGIERLGAAPRFVRVEVSPAGADVMEFYRAAS